VALVLAFEPGDGGQADVGLAGEFGWGQAVLVA
jgi:hypothetical protein